MVCILLAVGFAAGCKPKPSTAPAPTAYFKTSFQTESQFIVEAIVSDLTEQMFYAKYHRLLDKEHFSVTATEKPGSPLDTPVYELRIRLDPKQSDLKLEVNINGPIWSPTVYQDVAKKLAQATGLKAGNPDKSGDTTLLSKLTDGTPETIEQENQELSAALEKDFGNPKLHESAAVLLGSFLLREHSGYFFEIRSPLSRMTAHLAMARFLGGTNSYGLNGQMAEAMLLTLIGDQAPALERLNAIGTNDAAVAAMVRALRTRDTGDYRPLGETGGLSRIESIEWFSAMADYVNTALAWTKLNDEQQQTIDFVRIANQESYSVEVGHQLLRASIPLEIQEIQSVYELLHHEKLPRGGLVKALNELPEGCFSSEPGGKIHVHVIDWGQWAMFFQRHLCHAVQQNFNFLYYNWRVPDKAGKFTTWCDQEFGGLRLYPFVQRFNCTNVETYHKSVDDGFKVTVASPHLVSAGCWNQLCHQVSFAPLYPPDYDPHINEWFNHNPPSGTVYDFGPRLNHPSLVDRPDAMAYFEKLHELAPYDCRIANFILTRKYNNRPTYDQAMVLYRAVLPYSVFALRTVARTVYDKPEQYEKLMLQAAELDPACYYNLGDYALDRQEEDKAAQYIDRACEADPDRVCVASRAEWRVRYYLKKGQTAKARQIADEGGEVYSFRGLRAKAVFLEAITNYDGAFEWYEKIEERYNDASPLISFCQRYKALTGDTRFEPELQQRVKKLFPKGMEKVSLNDFHGPPTDGVLIKQQNDLLASSGLRIGDVIVALDGTRTHTHAQYAYIRDLQTSLELDLIVWQGSAYHVVKANPPNRRFGVDFGDYRPQ